MDLIFQSINWTIYNYLNNISQDNIYHEYEISHNEEQNKHIEKDKKGFQQQSEFEKTEERSTAA